MKNYFLNFLKDLWEKFIIIKRLISKWILTCIHIWKHQMREKKILETISYMSFTPCFLILQRTHRFTSPNKGNFCFASIPATITHYTIEWWFVKGSGILSNAMCTTGLIKMKILRTALLYLLYLLSHHFAVKKKKLLVI